MNVRRGAAVIFSIAAAGVVAFQLALALGAPWGEFAMGGSNPGQYPPALRIAAIVQAALIALMAAVVLSRAGVAVARLARASRWLIWVVVVLMGLSLVLNLITPAAAERAIWAPVVLAMLGCAVLVATGPPAASRRTRLR
jgi:hypothetical protein